MEIIGYFISGLVVIAGLHWFSKPFIESAKLWREGEETLGRKIWTSYWFLVLIFSLGVILVTLLSGCGQSQSTADRACAAYKSGDREATIKAFSLWGITRSKSR